MEKNLNKYLCATQHHPVEQNLELLVCNLSRAKHSILLNRSKDLIVPEASLCSFVSKRGKTWSWTKLTCFMGLCPHSRRHIISRGIATYKHDLLTITSPMILETPMQRLAIALLAYGNLRIT